MPNLQQRYKNVLKENNFQADAEQERAVKSLQRLLKELSAAKSFSLFSKKKMLRGVYLHGGVGRGKSMLMDLFFAELPPNIKSRRVHFHEFMIETHDWLHQYRGEGMEDLLPNYARHVSENVRVLCFDEFHVTDVADAMILGRLFTALFERGVVVVATSNWAPDNLYEGGLQRDLFLPFIDLLKKQMEIVHLDHDQDYRQLADPDQDVFMFYPLDSQTADKVEALFKSLSQDKEVKTDKIKVKGRNIEIKAAGKIACSSFADLCEKPLAAEDYIAIAARYDTLVLENIPRLDDTKRNETKRFILLIDCLYEAHCRLVMSAENNIHDLYEGDDHAFEFDRTVSRLMEMQSSAYHEKRVKT